MPMILEVWTVKDGFTLAINEAEPFDLTIDEYEQLREALTDYIGKPDNYYKRGIKQDEE